MKKALLVSSYDGNLEIAVAWIEFHRYAHPRLFEYFNVYVGLNNAKELPGCSSSQYKVLQSHTCNWSQSLESWLSDIDTDEVVLFLDDQYARTFMPKSYDQAYTIFCKYNMDYLALGGSRFNLVQSLKLPTLNMKPVKLLKSKYRISLQPSIWSKQFLLRVLQSSADPWELEIKASKECTDSRAYYVNSSEFRFFEQFIERGSCYHSRVFKIQRTILRLMRESGETKRGVNADKAITKLLKRERVALKRFVVSEFLRLFHNINYGGQYLVLNAGGHILKLKAFNLIGRT
jgi:hypothetical protein